jgi:hypothetical protein
MVPAPNMPVLSRPLAGGRGAIGPIVDDVIGGGTGSQSTTVSLARELLGLALREVLHAVTDIAGPQTEADASAIELWLQTDFLVIAIRFHGAPLPRWLLANWDRGTEPEVLAPPTEAGSGWLLVRDVFDSVSLDWAGSEQILLLEKRV